MNEQTQQQQEPVQIGLQDIATIVQLIDVVSRRGGIEGRELAGVGMLRNKLETFLQQNAPKDGEIPEGEMPADVDGPMADKVQ
jgi:hypothetical protein